MRFFIIIICVLLLNSCSTIKHVPESKYLLVRNNINLVENKKINKYEVNKIIKQKPNKRIFAGLLKFHLGIYNLSDSTKNNFLNNYFRKIGEKPVIFNETLTEKSQLQIERYFKNKGYLNCYVKTLPVFKNQKATIEYEINLGNQYTIGSIKYPKYILLNAQNKSEISKGDPLNLDLLKKEAERISRTLQNNGYYYFDSNSLSYKADTANSDSVLLIFDIDSLNEKLNTKYFIDNINIYMDQDSLQKIETKKSINFFNLNNKIKKKTITRTLRFSPGELYSLKKVQQTRSNLLNLKIFNSVNITFKENENKKIDCNIFLKKQKKLYYRIEAEGTNSSGNYGTSLNFMFGNKNTFRGAENFNFKFKGALETRKNLSTSESFFNIWEIGGETSLKVPRILFPIKLNNVRSPSTNFIFSFMKQQRPDFTRSILKTTLFGYNFRSKKNFSYSLNLAEFSYVKMFNESADFKEEYLSNQLLQNQYTDHLITGSSYTIIFNNQKLNKIKNYSFLKGKVELSGITTNLLANFLNFDQDNENNYILFKNRFTQYIITEIDFRRYLIFDKNNSLIFRTYFGFGYPYGNSDQIPAQKQFFGGGTNGVRAWNPFSLGPGSFQNVNNNIDYYLGDVKIETNIEYRFSLFKLGKYKMKGAMFADSGNIWYMKELESQPGSKFGKDFLSEMAIGLGFGLRYDVNLLIIRFDLATPVRYPYQINNSNWVDNPVRKIFEGDLNLNIGIGYPF